MKERLLVMNGQKLVQSEQGGEWTTNRVEKAGAVRPGIYAIHLAKPADKANAYDGVIVHADKGHVYQQVGKHFVKHDRQSFGKLPNFGETVNVNYHAGLAVVSASSLKLGRGMA